MLGECSMPGSSDYPNHLSTLKVRMPRNDTLPISSYSPNMARKAQPQTYVGPDWFLVEWMKTLNVTQAQLGRLTGWAKGTMNDIFHGRTGYYRQILNEAASALHVQPFELLMPPDQAMKLRRLHDTALQIAAENNDAWHGFPQDEASQRSSSGG